MMKDWEEFEIIATKFLNSEVSIDNSIEFLHRGFSDSNKPDVVACKHLFNIEVKLSPAQSGQIVVENSNSKFSFSKKSSNQEIEETLLILEHLNKNYSQYSKGGNIKIEGIDEILCSFVKSQYKIKGNSWILSADKKDFDSARLKCLVPISELEKNFNVGATLRYKKSGSRPIPKKDLKNSKKLISSQCQSAKFTEEKDKNFVIDYSGPIEFNNNLYLSNKGENKYELRKLSNTNNLNIVFEIKLKDNCQFKLTEFKKYLDNI